MDWYNTLNKPLLTPPNEVFTTVWIILYILLGISFIIYIKGGINKDKIKGLISFGVQLALNFAWGSVFFSMKNISAGLAIVCLMWFFTLLTIIFFYKKSKISAILLIPYFLWISFAIYLNYEFLKLN